MVMKLTGNFIHYDQKNLNGRIYTKECVEKIVDQFNKKENPVFGQLGYPEEGSFINLGDVSHEVEEIHMDEENNSIVGTIKIMDTPKGEIVKKLLNEDIRLYCRPRAIGTVNENGEMEDYELISFDLISGSDAFANIAPDDFLNFLTEPDTIKKL